MTTFPKHSIPPPADAPMPVRLLKQGTALFQPDIWVVDTDGHPRVWKTWARRPWLERVTLSVRLARREARVLAALQDLDGFPALLSMPHPWTIEMTLLEAKPIMAQRGTLEPEYFERLWTMVTAMHERGINHGDLRRKNLLHASHDPRIPLVVDFTQCLYFPPPRAGLRRWLFQEALHIDRLKFLKLKRWYMGAENLSPQELEEAEQIPWHLKAGRFLRHSIYRPLRRGRKRRKLMKSSGN